MELSASLLLSIGGIIASVASAFAIVKTKVSQMESVISAFEKKIEDLRDKYASNQSDEAVKIALLERNQEAHGKELAEVKSDIKTIMSTVQDIKEAILTVKKGDL